MPNRVADPAKKSVHDAHAGNRSKGATRIIFVPWGPGIGAEWTVKSTQWNAVSRKEGKGKTYRIVHYVAGVKDGFLAGLASDDESVIYVRGHGSPGQPSITSKYTPPGGTEMINDALRMDEVARRLMESGLSSSYAGTIKFYSCYSGTTLAEEDFMYKTSDAKTANDYQMKMVKEGTYTMNQIKIRELPSKVCAAKLGANYLRKKGFKKCVFYGYLGPLASEYSDDPNDYDDPNAVSGGSHKHVKLDNQLVNRPISDPNAVGSVRASLGRIQV